MLSDTYWNKIARLFIQDEEILFIQDEVLFIQDEENNLVIFPKKNRLQGKISDGNSYAFTVYS